MAALVSSQRPVAAWRRRHLDHAPAHRHGTGGGSVSNVDLVFIEQHEAELRDLLFATKDVEGAAYVLMRECNIASDPWERRSRTKLVVREIVPIPAEQLVSSSEQHVTW